MCVCVSASFPCRLQYSFSHLPDIWWWNNHPKSDPLHASLEPEGKGVALYTHFGWGRGARTVLALALLILRSVRARKGYETHLIVVYEGKQTACWR